MSTSESFGIVLLEAWLAGRPVIANRQCAAFHDMALDDENALLVEPDTLGDAIKRLRAEPELAGRLAKNGIKLVERFDWNNVTAEFVSICREMAAMGAQRQERVQLDNH